MPTALILAIVKILLRALKAIIREFDEDPDGPDCQ